MAEQNTSNILISVRLWNEVNFKKKIWFYISNYGYFIDKGLYWYIIGVYIDVNPILLITNKFYFKAVNNINPVLNVPNPSKTNNGSITHFCVAS